MKKKLALMIGMLMLVLSLSACGADPTTIDYNGKSYNDLESESISYLMTLNQYASAFNQYRIDGMTSEEVVNEVFAASGVTKDNYKEYGLTEELVEGIIKYMDINETYGSLAGFGEQDFTVTKSGNTTTSDSVLLFVDESGNTKEIVFELVYSSWNMEMTGITIDPVQTLGEKMANAGMNTLISISIVFIVLILISLIIYAFNIIPYLENKKKNKIKTDNVAPSAVVTPVEVQPETVDATDDLELVAVIAAAIAASEGCSTSDFVVRSINRR